MKTRIVLSLSICGMLFTLFTFCVRSEKEPEQRVTVPGYHPERLDRRML